ncbi:MAG: DeoR family transcriptional regulator [Pseudomonas sp.]|uniref:diguanylate cyclase domain-containing protein n=1 Tax=Pseudomonas sp. TaxID=306 RepID=UPI0026385607|nr:diguanylate cyclase [Pseudomonas sp.]MDB6049036.1 DeoR family transcriptional regulator [Pseudomonas sp.]
MSEATPENPRPSLRSVLGRGHVKVAFVAVSFAGLLLTLLAVLALRVYADHNLQLIARSISYTVEAAVVFNDRSAATESLTMIASPEEVAEATVFDARNRVLAQWTRPGAGFMPGLERQIARVMLGEPVHFPVMHQGQDIGSVVLVGHGASLLRFLLSGLGGILGCLAFSAVTAQYLSRRLLSGIVGPLRGLAEVAHAARKDRAFHRRVPEAAIAELNNLGNDFNGLLDELESWQSHIKTENDSLTYQANHDSLTGLPNRALFRRQLNRAIRNAAAQDEQVAVLFLDSDRFKEINDSYGHAAGDAVLISVAARVRAQLREYDLVARLGGDEFAVLLSPIHKVEDALRIADKIIASMRSPISLSADSDVFTSLSIGVAIFPDHGVTSNALLDAADAAMYQAKRLERGGRHTAQSRNRAENIESGADL